METSIIEKICYNIKTNISSYRYSLCSTWIIALLTYTFSFVHKLPNHDDMTPRSHMDHVGANHGRWILDIIDFIMPYSIPWINGLLSIGILSVSICYIIKIFKIENKFLQILLSGVLVSFQSVVGMMTFTCLNYPYSLSFLLSVIAVDNILKDRWKNYMLGCGAMIVSMGIYQAYWAVGVVFLLCVLIQALLEKNTVQILLTRGVKYLAFVVITAILYYIINNIIFWFFDIKWGWYADGKISNDWPIIKRLYWTVVNMYSCLCYGTYGFVVTKMSKFVHYFMIGIIGCGVTIPFLKKHEWGKLILSICLLILLPISINVMNIITPVGTHSLTLLPFIGIYILVIIVADKKIKYTRIYDVILLLFILLLSNNVLIANKNHFKQYIQYENAKSFYTGVMVRIQETDGFDKGSKIALIGNADELVWDLSDFVADGIAGITDGHIMNMHSRISFIKYFVGFDAPFADINENRKIINSAEFKSMPIYPYDGSVKKIGNVIVVKFSDVTDL